MKQLQLFFVSLLIFFSTCKEDDAFSDKAYPRLETLSVTESSGNDHQLFSGKITMRANHKILKHGFVWSTKQNPTLEQSFKVIIDAEPSEDQFSYEVTSGFLQNTIQYVRAFVQTSSYTIYGYEVPFTPAKTGNILVDISPRSGNIGETVVLTGLNLQQLPNEFSIFFDEIPATINSISNTEIEVIVPEGLLDDKDLSLTKDTKVSLRESSQKSIFNLDPTFKLEYPGKWKKLSDFPGTRRVSPISFTIGDFGYFGFGSSLVGCSSYFNDLWKYDAKADSWSEIATPLTARAGVTPLVYGSKVYLVGGESNLGLTKEVWEFDATSGNWTQKSNYPGQARKGGFGFVIGNYGYYGGTGYMNYACGFSESNVEFWRYDFQNDSWLKLDDFTAFSPHRSAAIANGSRAFLLAEVDQLFEFNANTNQWTLLSQIPFWTYNPLSSFLVNDVLSFGSTFNPGDGENIVYQFDLATMTWKNRTYSPDSNTDAIGAFGFGDFGIVIMNESSSGLLEVWRLVQ